MIPEISVVIPVYKGQDSIAPLVSMLHEELNAVSFEVILVVDGCPADSDSVCRKLAQDFENVNYKKFDPRSYILDNFSLDYSAKNLLKFFKILFFVSCSHKVLDP